MNGSEGYLNISVPRLGTSSCRSKKANGILLFTFLLLTIIFNVFPGERENIDKTFYLLKSGYERKDTALLAQCFMKMSDKQMKGYQDIFKITKDYVVTIDVTNVSFASSSNFARADARLTFKYKVFIDKYSEDKETSKPVSYLLYKLGARWCILGTHEPAKSGMEQVNDQNLDEINAALSKLPIDVRKKILNQQMTVSKARPTIQWATVPGAVFYVVSITKDDVTKVKETALYWKVEKYPSTRIDVPADIFAKLNVGSMYYCNIFAYTAKEESISGSILKFQYVSE